jgi:periplasmic protein TonB
VEIEMVARCLIIASGLFAAVPVCAQAADTAQNKTNWEVFQKLYPPRALAAREEGAVGFKVTIDKQGTVTQCEVTHSSGHPLLDRETCTLITLNAEFQPEQGLSGSQVRTREGMITWKLPGSKTTLNAPVAIAASAAPEKMVCKKTVRTGTIAGFERTCMTQREWARQSDEEREMWQEVQGKKGSTSGN